MYNAPIRPLPRAIAHAHVVHGRDRAALQPNYGSIAVVN